MSRTEPLETEIVGLAKSVLRSDAFKSLRLAHELRTAAEAIACGVTIVYQPDIPDGTSAVTLFEEHGFELGPAAFRSEEELAKSILHELFRLKTKQRASGVGATAIGAQTFEAHAFADRAWPALKA